MVAPFVISGCSTADLSAEHFEKRDIKYACFHFSLDGTPYKDDLGKSMPISDFYQALRDGAEPKTSQINVAEFIDHFTPFLEEGKDIVHVCLSSGISGTYNSALIARDTLKEEYPDRNIVIIDSLAASSGYGLLLDKMADLRDEGHSMEEIVDWVENHKLELNHWFFSTDLTFYVKGGRISKASGWFGTALNICPLLNVDFEGKLIPRAKIRGKRAVVKEIVKRMEALAQAGCDYNQNCYISHSDCIDDAKAVVALIETKFPNLKDRVEIYNIGTTIGSHTGPGTVALFFWGNKRVD